MPRIIRAALLAAELMLLGSCASSPPPATVHLTEPGPLADRCARYKDPTDFGRCRLFTGADGWRFIPEVGRSADLDTQLRCAHLRANAEIYARCVRQAPATGTSRSLTARPPAAPPAVSNVEPSAGPTPDVQQLSPPPTVARTIQRAPKPTVRPAPWCEENGSCYGDISSYTGRPKTVHVRGYYRKDGTYVRGHYRSRPRR